MMTVLRRLILAMTPNTKTNANFEQYYSKLLNASAGESGMPTAQEAQRDLRAALDRQLYYL
jgi:hypothetical protein